MNLNQKIINVNSIPSHLWEPSQLQQKSTIPKTTDEIFLMLELLVKSMKWLEKYEKWMLKICGDKYRNESLQGQYSSKASAVKLDEKWSELSTRFTELKTFEPEQNFEQVKSNPIQPNLEQPSQNIIQPNLEQPSEQTLKILYNLIQNNHLKIQRKFVVHVGNIIKKKLVSVHHVCGRTLHAKTSFNSKNYRNW